MSQDRPAFHFSSSSCILLALMLLILPVQWIISALVAAFVHESFHYIAIRLCGGNIRSFYLGGSGAEMDMESMSAGRELICALAGPAGGLLLLMFSRWIPCVAVCGVFQAVYNLLPIYPLDGGRVIRCAAELLVPKRAEMICRCITNLFLVCISVFALCVCILLKAGIVPLIFAAALWLKSKNTPCKAPILKVQ